MKEYYKDGSYEKGVEIIFDYFQIRDPLFFKGKNIGKLEQRYSTEVKNNIERGDKIIQGRLSFIHPWDMEKCRDEVNFLGDWDMLLDGDEEWCFMLNRHRHFQELSKCYFITEDKKYSKYLLKIWSDWIEKNPLRDEKKKTSWRRIEAGIRCENWVKSLELLISSQNLDKNIFIKILNSLIEHGDYIAEKVSSFSKTSNWGILEFHGLYILSHFLEIFDIDGSWRKLSIKMLEECIEIQILDDGTQWEQSPMYHNEVFHCYLNTILISQRKKDKLSKIIWDKTYSMAMANIEWQKPNYHQPLLGDSDDTDNRDLLTLATYLYKDTTLKGRSFTDIDYENYFLLGEKGITDYKKIEAKEPDFTSIAQKNCGDIYLRDSWKKDTTWISFHTKNLGGGHSHDNLLHLSLYSKERDYIVDPGRYTYVEEKGREKFKKNLYHSTPRYRRKEDSPYKGVWSNYSEGEGELTAYKFNPKVDIVEGVNLSHRNDGALIRRGVIFIKPNLLVLADTLQGVGELEVGYHLLGKVGYDDGFKVEDMNVKIFDKVNYSLSKGKYSSEYNSVENSTEIRLEKQIDGSGSIISMIYFDSDKVSAEEVTVKDRNGIKLSKDKVRGIKLTYNRSKYLIFIRSEPIEGCFFMEVENIIFIGRYGVYKKVGNTYKKIAVL